MVSDEVCGVVQGRFEFCGGIKSGEVMDGYGCIWKADRLQASGAYKLLVVYGNLCHVYHLKVFSRFDDVSNKLDWINLHICLSIPSAIYRTIVDSENDIRKESLEAQGFCFQLAHGEASQSKLGISISNMMKRLANEINWNSFTVICGWRPFGCKYTCWPWVNKFPLLFKSPLWVM